MQDLQVIKKRNVLKREREDYQGNETLEFMAKVATNAIINRD